MLASRFEIGESRTHGARVGAASNGKRVRLPVFLTIFFDFCIPADYEATLIA